MVRFLGRIRGCNRNDLVAAGIEFLSEPFDVAALASSVPAFVNHHDSNPLVVALEFQLPQPFLQRVEALFVFLAVQFLAQIYTVEKILGLRQF